MPTSGHEASRPARPSLDRALVLRTAIDLADEHGLEALTMRSLASALGVEAMSLYHHVANKDDLLDGMVDLVAAEVPRPDPAAPWQDAVRTQLQALHDALTTHRWASLLWVSRMNVGPARLALMEALLATLRRAGLDDARFDLAFHTLHNHVVGHAVQQTSFPYDDEELPARSAATLEDFPAERYPELAAHIRSHLQPASDERDSFRFGLDAILAALQ